MSNVPKTFDIYFTRHVVEDEHGWIDWRLQTGGAAEMVNIEVDAAWRGRGVGTRLFERMLNALPPEVSVVYAFTTRGKWHPSPHGVKACYNELFTSRLGQLMDAPILRGSIVFVADNTIPDEHRKDGGAAEGFHFGVARVPGQNFVEAHYTDIQNHAELPMAAAFLAWLNVGDQQHHNQFLRLQHEFGTTTIKSKTFLLIDMGNTFHNFKWTEADLAKPHDSYVVPRHMASKLTLAALQTAVDAIKAQSLHDIEQCLGDTPPLWGITEGERVAAAKLIDGIRGSLMDILKKGNPDIR